MKVLGWVALAITIVSVLIGVSPILLFGSQDGGDAGWVFLLATVPLAGIGLLIGAILVIIASVLAMRRGARLPGLIGLIGIIGSVVLGVAFAVALSSSGETVAAIVIGLALLGYLVGLVSAIWAGFAADPRR